MRHAEENKTDFYDYESFLKKFTDAKAQAKEKPVENKILVELSERERKIIERLN